MSEAIARSVRILRLVDDYHDNPTANTRTALRIALMDEFAGPKLFTKHQPPKIGQAVFSFSLRGAKQRVWNGNRFIDPKTGQTGYSVSHWISDGYIP